MATDRKVSTELEKLGKLVATLVEAMAQLQLDVAKMSARMMAIDGEVAAIARRLDRETVGDRGDDGGRDLAFEQEVFKKFSSRHVAVADEAGRQKRQEPGTKPTANLSKTRKAQKRKR